ncbi:hypothetical protein GCM10027589_42150 [Actinocorallia lasiicapitis]
MTVPATAHDLALLLTLVERRVVSRLAAVLRSAELTVEEWRVLALLADGRGHPMSEIADHTLLPPPTLTKIVDRLVAAALVYRRPDDQDRRKVLAFLSDRGRTRHAEAAEAVAADHQELALSLGPEETALLTVLLNKAAAKLT